MLKKEFNWYIVNQDELVKKHNGKFIVVVNETVVGSYTTKAKAYFESQKKYTLGTFLIQFCESGAESYSQRFSSRVTFA